MTAFTELLPGEHFIDVEPEPAKTRSPYGNWLVYESAKSSSGREFVVHAYFRRKREAKDWINETKKIINTKAYKELYS